MKTRILVVEDERTALRSLSLLLEDEGYEVLKAESGENGLRLALQEERDLILLDVRLPDVDGITILQRLRAGYSNAVVIIMTADTNSTNAIRATQDGAPVATWHIPGTARDMRWPPAARRPEVRYRSTTDRVRLPRLRSSRRRGDEWQSLASAPAPTVAAIWPEKMSL